MPGPPELEALVAQVEPVACSKLLLPAILLNRSDRLLMPLNRLSKLTAKGFSTCHVRQPFGDAVAPKRNWAKPMQ